MLDSDRPPLRVLLGGDAVDGLREHHEALLAEGADWEENSRSGGRLNHACPPVGRPRNAIPEANNDAVRPIRFVATRLPAHPAVAPRPPLPGSTPSGVFTRRVHDAGLAPSMGSIGARYDNGMMESFWGRMQTELLNRQRWKTQPIEFEGSSR